MSSEAYERLLAECREEWIVAGGQTFNLDVFAPSSCSTSNPPFNKDEFELLASVNVPMCSDRTYFTRDGYAVLEKVKRTDRARQVFTRLCNEAGAHLPPEFRSQLHEYCTWDKRSPASSWIGLMLYLEGEVARNPDGTYREQLCITQPFRAFIDAIEICRLHTDQRLFPAVTITDEAITITTPDSQVDTLAEQAEEEQTKTETESKTAEENVGGENTNEEMPTLSKRQYLILEAMKLLNAA